MPDEPAPEPAGPADIRDDPELLAFAAGMFDHAREGRTAELAAYVDAGLPVDLTNDSGDTLLMLAAYHAHAATVSALLERGADPERWNDRGQTPLAAAVFRRSAPTVLALLAAGADPSGGPKSALETARFFELTDMVALLEGREPVDPGEPDGSAEELGRG